jgi:beta-lactamase class A
MLLAVAVGLLHLAVPTASTVLAENPDAESRYDHLDGTTVNATPEATPVSATPSIATVDQIVAAIDALVADELGVYGVVLMRPDGTVLYSKNGDTPFVSASLYKLILLADICAAIDAGILTYDTPLYIAPEYFYEYDGADSYFDMSYAGFETTVGEALYASGAFSSNVAAKALLSLSSPDDLNWTASALGLTGTFLFVDPTSTPAWPPSSDEDTSRADASDAQEVVLSYATDGEVNLTTPADMANYFVMLVNGQIFNERVSAMIFDILCQQMVDDRFPALLPPGTQLAHKTGNLERVVHDVGVIYAPDGPIILAAMVEAPSNDERAVQVVQRLALIAYGNYDIPPLTAPVYLSNASPVALDGTTVEAGDGEDVIAGDDMSAIATDN